MQESYVRDFLTNRLTKQRTKTMTNNIEKMTAIMIDPFNRQITEIQITKDTGSIESSMMHMQEIYSALNCDLFTVANYIGGEGDALYVDDEGLLGDLDEQRFFMLTGDNVHHQPLAGMGLIMGTDDEGNSISPKITVERVREIIVFVPNSMILMDALTS